MSDINPGVERIKNIVHSDRVVLFMKGDRSQPMCGFSAQTAGILDRLVPEYTTVNVLEDEMVRQGVKDYSNWPTIPQLYVDGEFLGGCDLVTEAFGNGELHEALGVAMPALSEPEITLSDAAAKMIRQGANAQPEAVVFFSIDARFKNQLSLGQAHGKDVAVETNGVTLHLDPLSASRANGVKIDVSETPQGTVFVIDNPNAPGQSGGAQ